jgi:hypothetical protein
MAVTAVVTHVNPLVDPERFIDAPLPYQLNGGIK